MALLHEIRWMTYPPCLPTPTNSTRFQAILEMPCLKTVRMQVFKTTTSSLLSGLKDVTLLKLCKKLLPYPPGLTRGVRVGISTMTLEWNSKRWTHNIYKLLQVIIWVGNESVAIRSVYSFSGLLLLQQAFEEIQIFAGWGSHNWCIWTKLGECVT